MVCRVPGVRNLRGSYRTARLKEEYEFFRVSANRFFRFWLIRPWSEAHHRQIEVPSNQGRQPTHARFKSLPPVGRIPCRIRHSAELSRCLRPINVKLLREFHPFRRAEVFPRPKLPTLRSHSTAQIMPWKRGTGNGTRYTRYSQFKHYTVSGKNRKAAGETGGRCVVDLTGVLYFARHDCIIFRISSSASGCGFPSRSIACS